jgi:hypothetical protein
MTVAVVRPAAAYRVYDEDDFLAGLVAPPRRVPRPAARHVAPVAVGLVCAVAVIGVGTVVVSRSASTERSAPSRARAVPAGTDVPTVGAAAAAVPRPRAPSVRGRAEPDTAQRADRARRRRAARSFSAPSVRRIATASSALAPPAPSRAAEPAQRPQPGPSTEAPPPPPVVSVRDASSTAQFGFERGRP